MRSVIEINVNVPSIGFSNTFKLLEDWGISISKSGFIGLPEDLDAFFANADDIEITDQGFWFAFGEARNKWNDGDIAYV